MNTAQVVFFSVLGGVVLAAAFLICVMAFAEHRSRQGMNDDERQAAADSWRAAKRRDQQGIREAEHRLAEASARRMREDQERDRPSA